MAKTAFDSDRFREAYPPGIERSWWHVVRNRVIADAFARYVPKDARILEVGCGTGIVTAALRARGWNVNGVDLGEPTPDLPVSEHLRLGTDALTLPANERASFHVLALFDVIEHLEDAPGFLRSLLDAFPNARQVVVTVPARAELWTSFDDHYGHFRRYDRPMLRAELTRAGLAPVRVAYFFHGLYPVILLNNLIRGRKRDTVFKAPRPGFDAAVNQAIGSLMALGSRVLPGALVGSSIIAVANRQ